VKKEFSSKIKILFSINFLKIKIINIVIDLKFKIKKVKSKIYKIHLAKLNPKE
jgi:hypothetical protein